MPAASVHRPEGPHGISWELADQIRTTIKRDASISFAQVAADAGVAVDTVERIARNMRKRSKRDRKTPP